MNLKLTVFLYFSKYKIKRQSAISVFFGLFSKRVKERDVADDSSADSNDLLQASTLSNAVSESEAGAAHAVTNIVVEGDNCTADIFVPFDRLPNKVLSREDHALQRQ